MDYRYRKELTDDEPLEEMLANLHRGNHKSAQDESDQVAKLLKKDVDHGFAWVIPKRLVPLIPGSMVQSLGLAKQWTLDETGARIPKYRLTQDLSFTCVKRNRGFSIDSRIDMSAYPEMIYGWCLSRILHFVIALRLAFPETPILIAKYDYSDHPDGPSLHVPHPPTYAKDNTRKRTAPCPTRGRQRPPAVETPPHQFNSGISINLIVTRRPSRLCWSDSCPFGIGGYSLLTGFAWRIRIPTGSVIYGLNLVNNLLEFLGVAINILLELHLKTLLHWYSHNFTTEFHHIIL
jgi:hypothetical protein